ncbi:2Fe-2S iron-sulfur cluster-binding protein [Streptomyces sp. NPDC014861]|uniref:(2Fe-2S)-binding protein n=1 Tax=Streptomyces sp. NPDC014861 TaxID=3364923 RepID=UPI0036FDFA4E
MSTSNHEPHETAAQAAPGGWEPIPQSEGYDEGATAFVHLPPEFMLDGVPLEAPGHGYTPPMIVPLQPLPQAERAGEGVEFFAPEQGPFTEGPEPLPHGYGEESAAGPMARPYVEHDPHATAEWHFGGTGRWEVPPVPEAPSHDFEAGHATEPVAEPVAEARVDAPYAEAPYAEAPVEAPEPVSYQQAPPTLPGGAPAPWAVPEAAEEPAAGQAAEFTGEFGGEHAEEAAEGYAGEYADGAVEGYADGAAGESAGAPEAEAQAGPDAGSEPASEHASEREPEPGATVPIATAEAEPEAAPDAPVTSYTSVDSDEHPHTSYVLRVNGADRPVTDSWIGESLLYVLRERLGLAGAKDGCSQGECGACNVQVDGRLVASCLVPAATAAGSEVRTVEGLAVDGEPSDVQRALARCGTVQCGFCIPGMCMTVHDLLEGNHAPTELETRQALAGNLCRCSGYKGVLQAVEDVVAERGAAAEHATAGEDDASPRIPHQHDGGRA